MNWKFKGSFICKILKINYHIFLLIQRIPTANAPAQIDVLEGQLANESKIRLKHGRPIGSKDIISRKRRTQRIIDTPKEVHDKQKAP